jgi:prepilin-type N-terminal cleavage/methylation domain-containing protein
MMNRYGTVRDALGAHARNRAFTLIELLTVVGIIGLLIAIILPSMARARDQARRVKVRATLTAIEKGLEMFHNDFGEYPTSYTPNDDAIMDLPGGVHGRSGLWGAHFLCRAMIGHDGRGVDAEGRSLRSGRDPRNLITMAQLATAPRRGPYIEGITAIRDTDPRFGHVEEGPNTGHPVLVDGPYRSPILYYGANPRARAPFCMDGEGNDNRPYGQTGDTPGIYRQWDNFYFTGISDGSGRGFWDFANTGLNLPCHPLGELSTLQPDRINKPPPYYAQGKSFAGALHDEEALRAAGVVKPHNPDTFILLDAGPDGLWGTNDDIANF